MTAAVPACLQAIEHLPPGATLIIPGVTWDEYEQMLEDLEAARPGVRVTYSDGRLQAVSPLRAHELYTAVLADIGKAAAEALGMDWDSMGATTLKHPATARGLEPDAGFYLANAPAIRGKLTLDLATDPPPDLVIEVDLSRSSSPKLAISATLGVPEIWLSNGARTRILSLSDGAYTPVPASLALPPITSALLDQFLDLARTEGPAATLRQFRSALPARP